jgi:hypothetical protein
MAWSSQRPGRSSSGEVGPPKWLRKPDAATDLPDPIDPSEKPRRPACVFGHAHTI